MVEVPQTFKLPPKNTMPCTYHLYICKAIYKRTLIRNTMTPICS